MTTNGAIFLALSGLLALPAAAAPLWEQRFDAGFAEPGAVIEVGAAGDILVAANGSNDHLLVKYDADGNQLWRSANTDSGCVMSRTYLGNTETRSRTG
jgi:hypothetical protein